ncbi:B-cell receptor-associated protein 31-like-domain-containing protein [Jimgerdemannia flammicorona]|uniref:Endoplasmic reticulum transmembrane protein n=1 Tax=Jimgerdemannia flammicorona TaxID=994334 RepID=A0A433A038_9FUNG|nr:B-cell receptor-associated protein 31-like-domain-containing protein [Jimgerdemannia flammicorona]
MTLYYQLVFALLITERVEQDFNHESSHVVHDVRTDTNLNARKFYAQRNMYLTGFTLFLSLILNRTYSLIVDILKSEEKLEAVKKQAEAQAIEYRRLTESEAKLQKRVEELEAEFEKERKEARDFETLKKQSKQTSDEYIRLTDRYNELEKESEGRQGERTKDK